jgi:uncharacterized protein (TIGR03382 family)
LSDAPDLAAVLHIVDYQRIELVAAYGVRYYRSLYPGHGIASRIFCRLDTDLLSPAEGETLYSDDSRGYERHHEIGLSAGSMIFVAVLGLIMILLGRRRREEVYTGDKWLDAAVARSRAWDAHQAG